jgi:hypothetical protein
MNQSVVGGRHKMWIRCSLASTAYDRSRNKCHALKILNI